MVLKILSNKWFLAAAITAAISSAFMLGVYVQQPPHDENSGNYSQSELSQNVEDKNPCPPGTYKNMDTGGCLRGDAGESNKANLLKENKPAKKTQAPENEILKAVDSGHIVDSAKDNPEACFKFSQVLAKKNITRLRSYISVTPSEDYSVKQRGNFICLEGLRHGARYKIIFKKGLAGDTGVLPNNINFNLNIASRSPSASFADQTYVLPKTGLNNVIPITTVNRDDIDLILYRVGERNLRSIVTTNSFNKLDIPEKNKIKNELGQEMWAGKLRINNTPNKSVVTHIPVSQIAGNLKPGLYILSEKGESKYTDMPTQWFVVSDLGLSNYFGEDGFNVQVRSLASAKVMENVTVRVVGLNNIVVASAQTDAAGWANFSGALGRPEGGMRPLYITAETKEGDFVFLSLADQEFDLSSHGVAGREAPGPMEAYTYSDRGIYRPGETVKIGVLLRDDKGNAIPNLPLSAIILRPNGQEQSRKIVQLDTLGGALFDIKMITSAETGKWSINLKAEADGPILGKQDFQVEEFVPEKLKVVVNPYTGGKIKGTNAQIEVQADYLFGAPGDKLRSGGRAILRTTPTPFAEFKDFRFGLMEDAVTEVTPFKETATDQSGQATLLLEDIKIPDHTAPLEIRVLAEVADADGRPNRGYGTIPVLTHEHFVGLKPNFEGKSVGFGDPASFAAIIVDHTGKPLANTDVAIKWIDEDRKYRWYFSKGEWRSKYSKTDIEMENRVMRTNDKGQVTFTFKHPSNSWGYYRVEVRGVQGAAAADFTYRVGWSTATRSPDTPDMLELSLNKKDTKNGDTVEGIVKGPFAGRATVVAANKSILWRKDIELKREGSKLTIPVSKKWGVGAYVMVTAYRPGDGADVRGPSRAMGLKWLSVGREDKSLSVSFPTIKETKPSRPITIPVTVKGPAVTNGDPVQAVIFAVDEGILRLTQFKTPDPVKALLGQQRLQLAYRDLYGRLISPLKGRPGIVQTGSDEAGNTGGVDKRVFKSVALSSGIVPIGPNGKGEVTLNLPDFNGQLRLFAVAYSMGAVGSGKSNFLVRDKVVAELLPPRFMAPGDKAKTTLRLTNVAGLSGAYSVSLNSSDPIGVKNDFQEVNLSQGETKTIAFELLGKSIGNAMLSLSVKGPDKFNIKRTTEISVRGAQPFVSERSVIDLTSGNPHTILANRLNGFLPKTGSVSLNVSNRPQIDVANLVEELDRYPYGCLEQTTSASMPLLYFESVKKIWPDVAYDQSTLKSRVSQGIKRILSKQRTDGSFGLWTNNSESEPWLTAYATEFLLEAKRLGHYVPGAPLQMALNWMKQSLSERKELPTTLAYWTKVLSEAGQLGPDEVRYYQDQISLELIDPFGKASLMAAGLRHGFANGALSFQEFALTKNIKEQHYDNYGSQLRDVAAALTMQPSVFTSSNEAMRALELMSDLYTAKRYTSTQEKAWLLRAALSVFEGTDDTMNFSVGGKLILQDKPYARTFRNATLKNMGDVILKNNDAAAPLFVTQTVSGIPASPLKPSKNGFSITREYFNEKGEPTDPAQVVQGTRMIVKLSVTHTENFEKRALVVDLLPAGFEIEPASIGGLTKTLLDKHFKKRDTPVFKAERDDRYVAAYDLPKDEGAISSVYVVRATTPGTFVHPAPFVEDMYKPEYSAIGEMDSVTISERP